MRNYYFDVRTNEEYASTGFALRGMEGAEPLGALTAVHDLFEHPPGVLDSDNEAQALGAMLWIRGEGGYFQSLTQSAHKVSTHLGSDLPDLWTRSYDYGGITDPGRTRPLDEHVEEWIDAAISDTREELQERHGSWEDPMPSEEWYGWVRGWLRKGYRWARGTRYRGHSAYMVACLFHDIEQRVQALSQRLEPDVGQVLHVRLSRASLCAEVQLLDSYDPEHPDYDPSVWEHDEVW